MTVFWTEIQRPIIRRIFLENAEDAQKFATGIYLYLIEPENHTIMTDCYTDNAIPVHVTAEQGQLSAGTATSSNPHFLQLWKMPINASADAGILRAYRRCADG